MSIRYPKLSEAEINTYVESRLPGFERNGDVETRGSCPVHQGDRDSFSLNLETGASFCHAQCGRGWRNLFELERELSQVGEAEAIAAVGRLVGREFPVNGAGEKQQRKTISAVYRYPDEQGKLLYEILRYEPKEFRVRRPHPEQPGKHLWNLKKVRRVLYGLPELIPASLVFICEGEKDADTLRARGYIATTAAFGARQWRPEYSEFLRNKHVVVTPDNDQPGREHALVVAHCSLAIAARIQIVALPEGVKDITEFFEKNHTKQEFDTLVSAAPEITAKTLGDWASEHGVAGMFEMLDNASGTPYRLDDQGVWYHSPDPDRKPTWICAPLSIKAETRAESGGDWGRLLEWTDRDGRVHTRAVPQGTLAADPVAVREYLANEGLRLGYTRTAREQLPGYLSTYPVHKKMLCVTRTGFHGSRFVLPDQIIPDGGDDEVVLQSPHDYSQMYQLRGTLEGWQTQVAAKCVGNPKLIFSVSAGFAPALQELSDAENGGVMFVGPSSISKSTAQIMAASVAGHELHRCRSTSNALESTCEAHSGSLLVLDELKELPPHELGQLAYMLSAGRGKERLNRFITLRKPFTWKLISLLSSEETIANMVCRAGGHVTAGAEVRMLPIPCEREGEYALLKNLHKFEKAEAFSVHLKAVAQQHVGHPYREFLRRLLPDRVYWLKVLRIFQAEFKRKYVPADASGEVFRAADLISLIGIAGSIATDLKITLWDPVEVEEEVEEEVDGKKKKKKRKRKVEYAAAYQAAVECFQHYLKYRGGAGAGDVYVAVQAAKDFLEVHGARFQDWEDTLTRVDRRAGFRKKEDGLVHFYVFRSCFEKEICRGCSPQLVAATLKQEGLLLTEDKEHWTVKHRWPETIPGNSRMYHLVAPKEKT